MARWVNEGGWDRVVRIIAGAALLYLGLAAGTVESGLLDVVGAVLVLTGATGFCLVYRVVGWNSRSLHHGHRPHQPAH